jgi:hypothetical protein
MNQIAQRTEALDVSLFDAILSQTSEWDRRALLALHAAAARLWISFTYLEIGSYLGGSLQALVRDPRCARIVSIDTRPEAPPDNRTSTWTYEGNSTMRMLQLLATVPDADTRKIVTFDVGTDALDVDKLPARPDYCLIDGEHTDQAVLRDAQFCASALDGHGVIAFHDRDMVRSGIHEFLRQVWSDVSAAVVFNGLVLAVEFGNGAMLRSPPVNRAIASSWHSLVWRLASKPRLTPTPLFVAWSAVPVVDRLVASVKRPR